MTTHTRARIIRAYAMLTPDGVIEHAELEIDAAGRIAYVGTVRAESLVTDDLAGHILMPGLVNGHTHSAMTLMRGASDDAGFMPWLAALQATEQHMTRDDVLAGLELAMLEMISTGTTTFADMYYWDIGLLERVRDAGMRVLAAPAMFTAESVGFPSVSASNGAEMLDLTEQYAAAFEADEQIKLAFGPHAPYTTPAAELQSISARSQRSGIPIHIHVAESVAEVADIEATHGATPVAYLDGLGFFNAQVLAAHCVHLTDAEIALFARTGTAVSHNPISNMKLGCGVARLPELLEAGVRLTLGTDSAASNNSLDLFEEIKFGTILHRGARLDAAAVRAADVIDIATRRGAAAIGFPETGALEVGKLGDVIALDVRGANATPHAALVSHIAFAASGADVRHVFIGGRHVYADGAHLTLDADDIVARASVAAERLRGAATSAPATGE